MEEVKKRKLEDTVANGEITSHTSSEEDLRALLDPLAKTQLVDLLSKLPSLTDYSSPPSPLKVPGSRSDFASWRRGEPKDKIRVSFRGSRYPSIAEEIRSVASADPANRKLFVRGLAWNTTSDTLCAAFQEHGEIEEGAVIIDKASGKSRGYGFITFKDISSARRALEAPSKLIDGRMAVCILASEGLTSVSTNNPDQAQRKLYIGGLSPETSSEMLLHFFSRHGEIEEGSVAYDKDTNKSRGFGFITYKSVEAAKKAIDDPQKSLGGRNITVKLADNQKGKVVQTQLPPAMVQVSLPLAAGYPQPGNPNIGYTYPPQPVATYPASAYPNSAAAAPYPMQSQVSYPSYAVQKEPVVPLPTAPAGIGGYPYYFPKQ